VYGADCYNSLPISTAAVYLKYCREIIQFTEGTFKYSWCFWHGCALKFLLTLQLLVVLGIRAKRLAGKSVSNMTDFVSSGTLNLNSINQ